VVYLGPRGAKASHGTAPFGLPRRGRPKEAESGTFGAPNGAPMGRDGLFWGPRAAGGKGPKKGPNRPKRPCCKAQKGGRRPGRAPERPKRAEKQENPAKGPRRPGNQSVRIRSFWAEGPKEDENRQKQPQNRPERAPRGDLAVKPKREVFGPKGPETGQNHPKKTLFWAPKGTWPGGPGNRDPGPRSRAEPGKTGQKRAENRRKTGQKGPSGPEGPERARGPPEALLGRRPETPKNRPKTTRKQPKTGQNRDLQARRGQGGGLTGLGPEGPCGAEGAQKRHQNTGKQAGKQGKPGPQDPKRAEKSPIRAGQGPQVPARRARNGPHPARRAGKRPHQTTQKDTQRPNRPQPAPRARDPRGGGGQEGVWALRPRVRGLCPPTPPGTAGRRQS